MLINLSIILLSNSRNFSYYAHRLFSKINYVYFKIYDLKNDYEMLLIKWLLDLNMQRKVITALSVTKTQEVINCGFQFSKTELLHSYNSSFPTELILNSCSILLMIIPKVMLAYWWFFSILVVFPKLCWHIGFTPSGGYQFSLVAGLTPSGEYIYVYNYCAHVWLLRACVCVCAMCVDIQLHRYTQNGTI